MGRVLAHTALFINRFFDPWKKNNRKILWQKKNMFFFSPFERFYRKKVFSTMELDYKFLKKKLG